MQGKRKGGNLRVLQESSLNATETFLHTLVHYANDVAPAIKKDHYVKAITVVSETEHYERCKFNAKQANKQ
jgi:hypothetical protein